MPHTQLSNPSKKMCYWKNNKIFDVFNFFPSQIWCFFLEIKVNEKWDIPKFFTITNNSLNWVWCHYGINGIEDGRFNFMIFLRTSTSNHWGCWHFDICTSLFKHKCFVKFNSWIDCRTWYIKSKYGGYNVKIDNNVDILHFK